MSDFLIFSHNTAPIKTSCFLLLSAAAIQENYEYYEDEDTPGQSCEPIERPSDIEWFDIRTRRKRDTDNEENADQVVTYEVCVK